MISANASLPEITLKVIILSVILTVILAASNTYLALKIGMLTSASIPAAALSMAILRFFKKANILENNLIQTAASAGEAIAGGIVYTIPALIIIHYWHHFGYFENFSIALCGGILGVLFSVPLRRILVNAENLTFPEGRAIAEVLQLNDKQPLEARTLLIGGLLGALLEFAQTGLRIVGDSLQKWFVASHTVFGFGLGFSATLLGAGYLIRFNTGLSFLIGATTAWGIGLPLLSTCEPFSSLSTPQTLPLAMTMYSEQMHYMGVGAMVVAGLWTLFGLLKPCYNSLRFSLSKLQKNLTAASPLLLRTERDLPVSYVVMGIGLTLVGVYNLFNVIFPNEALGLSKHTFLHVILLSTLYSAVLGFIFSTVCGYFSGLVGVSSSPGSAILIAGLLVTVFLLRLLIGALAHAPITHEQLRSIGVIAIMIGSITVGAAAITNDSIQDLKVGQIIGATPWKQQLMLIIGVIVASATIPIVMEFLFRAYGIANVLPHAGMDASRTLVAPPAAMIAGLTQSLFDHDLPWHMLSAGAVAILIFIAVNYFLERHGSSLSILGIAIGIYLPLKTSTALFIGSLFAWYIKKKIKNHPSPSEEEKIKQNQKNQRGLLVACGLVSGAALMDVLLAFAASSASNYLDILSTLPAEWRLPSSTLFSIISLIGLSLLFYKIVMRDSK